MRQGRSATLQSFDYLREKLQHIQIYLQERVGAVWRAELGGVQGRARILLSSCSLGHSICSRFTRTSELFHFSHRLRCETLFAIAKLLHQRCLQLDSFERRSEIWCRRFRFGLRARPLPAALTLQIQSTISALNNAYFRRRSRIVISYHDAKKPINSSLKSQISLYHWQSSSELFLTIRCSALAIVRVRGRHNLDSQ